MSNESLIQEEYINEKRHIVVYWNHESDKGVCRDVNCFSLMGVSPITRYDLINEGYTRVQR